MKTVDCAEPIRLDPRVRRTRKAIEEAFRALLAERPYAAISVADVTSRADINRGTFYAHFEDKEHLATSIMREELETTLRAHLEHGMPLNAENLARVAEAAFEFFGRRMVRCEAHDSEFAPTLMAVLQETVQTLIRMWLDLDEDAMRHFAGATKDDAATVVAWSLYGGALRWSHLARRPPASEAARRIVALLLRLA